MRGCRKVGALTRLAPWPYGRGMVEEVRNALAPAHQRATGGRRRRSGRLWAGGTVHELIASKRAEIEALCQRLGVRRLDLFGSALDDRFDEKKSDIDVLVEFTRRQGFDYVDAYFALKEGLEKIFGRPVDVVSVTGIRNPYFRDEVMRTRELLYAA